MRYLTLVLLCTLSCQLQADPIEYRVSGLEAPAEILVDQWGVPHIYAQTHYDAFFVQGFNAARDRLWQIDLWRRRGLGQLAEILGPAYVQQDEAARLFLYRGSMFHEWLAYGSDAKRIAEAFTSGINAYITLTRQNRDLLPIEFGLLDYLPAEWRPEDVVRIRSNGLWRNVSSEVTRARVVCEYGLETDAVRKKLEPDWRTVIPEGLDPCVIPADVLKLYSLAKAPVNFGQALQFAGRDNPDLASRLAAFEAVQRDAGSNNWAVAPQRTTTGRPILANDPHRGHAVPSLRYVAHLVAPGLNVIGAGEPALPGISIGHNERIAFGLTIFSIDQEDLMVYEVRRNRYRYQGEWVPFEEIEEPVKVRNGNPATIKLKFTRHGPVVLETGNLAFAVRAAWLEPGMAPYFGSVEYMRAQNWRQFLAALNRWGAPAENQVYADIEGNIGYKPAGLTPIRENYDGLLPVPGDGTYEWEGFYDMDRLPVEYNPGRGWVATANAMSLPPDYPYQQVKPGFEWSAPWRIDRISEVLEATLPHGIQDSLDLQRDYLSIPARRILTATPIDQLPEVAESLFSGWDFRLLQDSGAAALFEIWYGEFLQSAVIEQMTDAPTASLGYLDPLVVVEAFEQMPMAQRLKITAATMPAAISRATALLGNEPAAWRWGNLHTMAFEHPLLPYVDDETRDRLAMPVVSRGGSGDTPNATRHNRQYSVTSGGSWRMVLDVGNWDRAFMTNAPGQSGDPASEHYDDLLEVWAADGQLPLLYSRDAINKHVSRRIVLQPEPLEEIP
ncbi:MAG: penicillin acylase family protein [Pseudomonadota bacterium]